MNSRALDQYLYFLLYIDKHGDMHVEVPGGDRSGVFMVGDIRYRAQEEGWRHWEVFQRNPNAMYGWAADMTSHKMPNNYVFVQAPE